MSGVIRLPTLFLSHGGGPAHALDNRGTPFAVIDKNSPSAHFLRSLPRKIEEYAPMSGVRAILIITAHWEESEFTVDYQNKGPTKLVYDYYGFDRKAYAPYLTYPVPTDLIVADRVFQLLQQNNIPARKQNRGFDHGTFMPMLISFPEAKIPVVQLSLKAGLDPAEHFRVGESLRPLREEGVLIIGSGSATHNLGAMDFSGRTDARAHTFLSALYTSLTSIKTEEDYQQFKQTFLNSSELNRKLPHFNLMHPRTEHFTPLLVAVAAGMNPAVSASNGIVFQPHRIYNEVVAGSLGLDSYLFQ